MNQTHFLEKTHGSIAFNKVFIFLWLLFYILLANLDLSAISGTMGSDSDNIMHLAANATGAFTDTAYINTALFFSFIPSFLLQPFILLVGCVVLTLLMKNLHSIKLLGIAAFISIPAILFILVRPQKETIVALLSILVLCIFSSHYRLKNKIVLSLLIYGLYAYFFRQYYFIIIMVFLALLVFIHVNKLIKLALFCAVPVVMIIIPDYLFTELQGARDLVNLIRINTGEDGSRTAFMNPIYPDGPITFVGNYIYAFLRLNFSPIFYPGIRELFLLGIMSCYGYLVFIGIKSKSKTNILCSSLILAHAMVYWIFEPDLGSYLRHISSVILYLVPILVSLDRQKQQ